MNKTHRFILLRYIDLSLLFIIYYYLNYIIFSFIFIDKLKRK